MNPGTQSPHYLRCHAGQWETLRSEVIVETPVSVTVNGHTWITLMCTPTDLEALAVGFLFNEAPSKAGKKSSWYKSARTVTTWMSGLIIR